MLIEKANEWEASRMQMAPFSGIRRVSEKAAELRVEGIDIIEMTMGRPDFDTPLHIKKAAEKALEEGKVHYTSNYGIPELRKAIARKMEMDNGLEYKDKEILVSCGAAEAIYATMSSFLQDDDEVIIPTPAWNNYLVIPGILGAKVVSVPLKEEKNFALSAGDVEKRITSKTKMLVLISPNNPTGGVMLEEDLRGIAALAVKHNFIVISDEIYEHLIYDGKQHISIAAYPGMKERTVVINGVSKAYSMTGWRVGWAAAHEALMQSLVRSHQYMVACANAFAQYGALEALEGPQDCVAQMVGEFGRRRNLLVEALNSLPGISCVRPSGAFYVFANIKGLNMTSLQASDFFLENAGVAVVPGSVFGEDGEGYLRFAYSNSYENILRAVKRMREALKKGGKL